VKIKFKVNETEYQLTSDKYQMILNKVTLVQSGKTEGQESFQLVGYFKDEFKALEAVYYAEKYDSDCVTLEELKKLSEATLTRLNELSEQYKLKV
jgi:hypothetical protein